MTEGKCKKCNGSGHETVWGNLGGQPPYFTRICDCGPLNSMGECANLVSAAGDAGNNQETGEHQAQHSSGSTGSPATTHTLIESMKLLKQREPADPGNSLEGYGPSWWNSAIDQCIYKVRKFMGDGCPSGSRIGSTEAEVQGHAGSNPAPSPASSEIIENASFPDGDERILQGQVWEHLHKKYPGAVSPEMIRQMFSVIHPHLKRESGAVEALQKIACHYPPTQELPKFSPGETHGEYMDALHKRIMGNERGWTPHDLLLRVDELLKAERQNEWRKSIALTQIEDGRPHE